MSTTIWVIELCFGLDSSAARYQVFFKEYPALDDLIRAFLSHPYYIENRDQGNQEAVDRYSQLIDQILPLYQTLEDGGSKVVETLHSVRYPETSGLSDACALFLSRRYVHS